MGFESSTNSMSLTLVYVILIILCSYIIRRYGLNSYEGIGVLIYILILYSPFIVFNNMQYDMLLLSGWVHFVGIFSLALGLFTCDLFFNRGYPLRVLGINDSIIIDKYSNIAIFLGIFFALIGPLTAGYSVQDILMGRINDYGSNKSFLGGWVDKGLIVFDIGIVVKIMLEKRLVKLTLLFLFLCLAHYLFSFSRGGILPLVFLFICTSNHFRVNKSKLLYLIISSIVISIPLSYSAYKIRSNDQVISASPIEVFSDRIKDRLDDEGLAIGYANLVDRLNNQSYPLAEGAVISYSILSNIPVFIYENKPDHPMRATGYLVYDSRPSDNFDDVSAFGLVGSAFFDFDYFSTIFYLYIVGIILGIIKIVSNNYDATGFFYIFFIFIDGATNFIHGGVTTILGGISISIFFIILVYLFYNTLLNKK